MTNTSHSQPCAAVPDSEALCAARPSVLSEETLPLNHGRNNEISTTSDATPAIFSLRVHRRASKLYPEDAAAWPADPPGGVHAGGDVIRVVFSAARVPQRGHASVPAAMSKPHCTQVMFVSRPSQLSRSHAPPAPNRLPVQSDSAALAKSPQ